MAPLLSLRSWLLFLLVALALSPAPAASLPIKQGLTISLSTGIYEVEAATEANLNKSFSASAALVNLSAQDVAFSFTDSNAAVTHFQFRILNSVGTAVWESDTAAVTAESATPDTLESQSGWRRTVRVPVAPQGQPLTVGLYTLEARIAGTPTLAATTLFSVVAPGSMGDTGIQGQVLRGGGFSTTNSGGNPTAEVGQTVSMEIREMRLPNARYDHPAFLWSGTTDSHGFYKVATPPGTFTVTVFNKDGIFYPLETTTVTPSILVPGPVPKPYAISTTVKVKQGSFTEQLFFLPGGPIVQPPTLNSGIKGHVTTVIPPVILDGATTQLVAAVPVVGASVVISRLPIIIGPPVLLANGASASSTFSTTSSVSSNYIIYPSFGWTGVTDSTGRFKADLYPGTYRVRISAPGTGTTRLISSSTVTVTSGQYTPLEIQDPGITVTPTSGDLIYNVTGLSISSRSETQITLLAQGQVTTGGWQNPRLVPRASSNSSLLEFDFVADRPTGIVTQIISAVKAETTINNPQSVKTIRVYYAGGSKEITP